MKRLLLTLAIAGLATNGFGNGTTGEVVYQNTDGPGTERYIYGARPHNYFGECPYDNDYPFIGELAKKLSGTAYWAELWYGDAGAAEPDLSPAEGSRVHFGTGVNAGLINGNSKFLIPGTQGGDRVTFQLRVWEAGVASWGELLPNPWLARGASSLIANWELGGVDAQGTTHVGSGSISKAINGFCLYVVPEPSVFLCGALGLGALFLRRREQTSG